MAIKVKRDIKKRLRIVYLTFALTGGALTVLLFTASFAARRQADDSINDYNRLRDHITADSIRAIEILAPRDNDTTFLVHLEDMPNGCERLRVDRSIHIGREFIDKNPEQLSTATIHGIEPLKCVADAWKPSKPLVKVTSNPVYYIDELNHSLPFLIPPARALLNDIATTFHDSLEARGGGAYRLKVTSLLRTEASVARLRRRNVNATTQSAHLYGTTFDISYSNFICDSLTVSRSTEDLKYLLAEVLSDFRNRGLCWVKHERKQSCFHITLRRL